MHYYGSCSQNPYLWPRLTAHSPAYPPAYPQNITAALRVELKNPSVAEQVFWRLQQVTSTILGSRLKADKLLKHLGNEAEMVASLKETVAAALARCARAHARHAERGVLQQAARRP